LPQAPQLAVSLRVSTQRLAHAVWPVVQTSGASIDPSPPRPASPPTTLLPDEQATSRTTNHPKPTTRWVLIAR
jgi:hypothetical protein